MLHFSSVSKPAGDVKRLLLNADAVCFDVDSTVIEEEGIDMLAEFKGAGEAVAEWTKKYVWKDIYYTLHTVSPTSTSITTSR